MKKLLIFSLILGVMLAAGGIVVSAAGKSGAGTSRVCTTIQSGDLVASDGSVITTGFDEWGYNYQGRLFNGMYCDSYRDAEWCQPYKDVNLMMKWNDAWLSNTDCDGWDVTGDWEINVKYLGIDYPETLILKQVETTIDGVSLDTIPPGSFFTVYDGSVIGNEVNIYAKKESLVVHMEGTIAADGSMNGVWADVSPGTRSGTWETTTGVAVKTLNRHFGFDSYIGSGAWLTNHQSGEYTDWNVLGDWVLEFDWGGDLYIHDMIITDNTFTGTGAAQFSSQTWIVSGDVDENTVDFTIFYDGLSYEVYVTGVISSDGTMSGAWSTNTGQSGDWKSTSGEAIRETCKWNYFVKIVAVPEYAVLTDGIWYTADGTEIGPVIWGAFAIIQEVENDECAGLNGMQYVSPAGAGLGQYKENEHPIENAVEVSPGVLYLGEAMDKGKPVKGYAFVHYAKDSEPEVSEISPSECYNFVFGPDVIWEDVENYVINPANKAGLNEDDILSTFEASVATWENEVTSDYDIIGIGALTDEKFRVRRLDNTNSVSFRNLPRGVIGMNILWRYIDGPLAEWDQVYSNRFDWSISDKSVSGKMDFQNIATHELGHAVGLGDLYNSDCSEQTMYGYSTEGEMKKRTLELGDIAGLNILY